MQNQITDFNFKGFLKLSTINILLLLFSNNIAFAQEEKSGTENSISKTVYFTANTGLENEGTSNSVLKQIVASSKKDKDASFVLLGNLTSNNGYPKEGKQRDEEEKFIKEHLFTPLKDFNGSIIYTPGVNEWNKGGHKNIDDLESFLQDNSKGKFWPNDGCALEHESLSDNVELVMVDSQWFLEDWDEHPYINNKCDLKTREQFFVEFADEIKDNQGKTVIVAIHHPILTNTKYGFINKIGGFSKNTYQNDRQKELHSRLETIARQFDDVIFVSGNDRNLQYLDHHEVPQIISGATISPQSAKIKKEGHFASSKIGYAKLEVYKDGSSKVYFYEALENSSNLLFAKDIKRQRTRLDEVSFKPRSNYGKTEMSSIYTEEETEKSGFYKWIWGDHYREIYSKKIAAPTLFLEDLPGNVKPISEGGGHQSRSLRLINDNENEFTLRALRKSAIRFIQNNVKEHYVGDIVENTIAERVVMDYYTTAHPYAQFATNDLMEALNIYHINPEIFYVPKQKGLGIYNDEYGDELYMLEKHVGDENKEFEEFGKPDDILSTSDLLEEIQESKDAYVDEDEYIKARLFDMLVGDWDRHQDQWRWSEFSEDGNKKKYEPIPRDRDQAFSKYDGPIIDLLKLGVPAFRAMQSYGPELKQLKWFNVAGYPLDNALIKTSKWEDWKKQVTFIQENLTDEKIDAAFANLPKDVKDESITQIKKNLKLRRGNLEEIARNYYNYLSRFQTVIGTEEDDQFLITRKDNGITEISITKDDKVVFTNEYDAKKTKEIWIYGLDGDDEFKIEGKGSNLIQLKILGGEENDIYDFENTHNAKLYDYKSKKNTIKNKASHKWLVDSYEINNYDYTKRKYSQNTIFPSLGYSSDAGLKAGISDTYTTYGLAKNPFTTQHTLAANYYFATSGLELDYKGEFAHIFYNWNLGIDAYYSSPNFTLNYFGTGNDTRYDDGEVDLDYNRVNIEQLRFAPSLIWNNDRGSKFYIKPIIEALEVSNNEDRFINDTFNEDNDVFDEQLYGGIEASYQYLNKEHNPGYPNLGMQFDITSGYKTNIDEHNNEFAYVKPALSIDYPLHPSGVAVLATKIGADFIIGDNYEFYHAATLGGNNSLRAYRNERFNGKSAFYQSTDLRVGIMKLKTNFIPLRLGLTAGFDYGRVWTENDNSEKWHNGYGGSVFVNGFSAFTGNVGYYTSSEGARVVFTFGFKF
ncbi:metallophosphatase [Gillisia sp. M10.2A]|uniref:Metallophosphatase n=1 Tax=Gillisia lutea TaxID=2909668 RepID=A0ABS9ED53_9FLAO|nr:metallophosphatase [Gillisia lutea]MCF4100795.1 metallophosphatase [Gillisia lutea]